MGLRAVISRPFNTIYGSYKTKVRHAADRFEQFQHNFKLPERFKGTFVEKWAEYWQAVYKDYKEVAFGLVTEVRDKPYKGAFWAAAAGAAYYCAKKNPDDTHFRNALLSHCNEFLFVGPTIRNPETTLHLKTLERFYNEGLPLFLLLSVGENDIFVDSTVFSHNGQNLDYLTQSVLKRQSFGLFSILWVDNYRDCVGAYKATCPYMLPDVFSFYTRIVDVGFLDRWWILEKKMIDCDINPSEWSMIEDS